MTIRILFLASSPRNEARLSLDKEVRLIHDKLDGSKFGDQFEIDQFWGTRPRDLQKKFGEGDVQIVHYSGHGSDAHELLLMDDADQAKAVSKELLADLFEPLRHKARVAFFNACHSEGQAGAVTRHIDCAIGMSRAVGDSAAITMAGAFYAALAESKSVKEAFEQGLRTIQVEGIKGADIPRLHARPGVDPDTIFLLEDARRPPSVPDAWREHLPVAGAPPEGLEWHACIAARSSSEGWCVGLRDVLREHGFLAYTPHSSEPDEKDDGSSRSAAGILVWSGRPEDEGWLRAQAAAYSQRAAKGNFRVLAVQLDRAAPADAAPGATWLDFSAHQNGPGGGPLLELLHALAGVEPSEAARRFAAEQEAAERAAREAIAAAEKNADDRELTDLFERGGLEWETSACLGCLVAESLVALGRDGAALEVLRSVSERFPRALRPKQLQALALARRGDPRDTKDAQALLSRLVAGGDRDPETLGIYARTWFDRYLADEDEDDLEESRDLYAEALERTPDSAYAAINAAAKSAMLGELDEARGYAARARAIETERDPDDYWGLATLAEAALILGETAEAVKLYKSAVKSARKLKASHESTWKQACHLRKPLGIEDEAWKDLRAVYKKFPDYSA